MSDREIPQVEESALRTLPAGFYQVLSDREKPTELYDVTRDIMQPEPDPRLLGRIARDTGEPKGVEATYRRADGLRVIVCWVPAASMVNLVSADLP
jgi:hypothetical protein